MKEYLLNGTGKYRVRRFVESCGKDGLILDYFYTKAEDTAWDAFNSDQSAVIEIDQFHSYDGRPYTLRLEEDWFTMREVEV